MLPSQLPMFVIAAQCGSFSAAGRKLGISAAAVSKGVATLEKQTGVRLFHRNTRQFSLTDDGATLFHQVAPLLLEVENSIERLSEQHRRPAGRLKVNLPDSFGKAFIMPHIPEFMALYPEIKLDLVFDDQIIDIIDKGFDVGIGNRINQDSRLIARELYSMQSGIFASQRYLARHGEPQSFDELKWHQCIGYKPLSSGRLVPWTLVDSQDRVHQFVPDAELTVSNISAAKMAVEQGLGISYMGCWHMKLQLTSGHVKEVLKPFWPRPSRVWLYYSSKENLPSRVRLFIDFIVARVQASVLT